MSRVMVKVENLYGREMVDLSGDTYADPKGDDVGLEFEYAIVESVIRETVDCIVVYFENFSPVGFPLSHEVSVELR